MQNQQIQNLFNNFLEKYDLNTKDAIWAKQSEQFRDFWKTKILSDKNEELTTTEIDQIIKILDRNGKGNTKESEAVARAMVAQGAWQRMFNEIKSNKDLSQLLDQIFSEQNNDKKSDLIGILYEFNVDRRNNLTGPSGNAINAMLAAFDPIHNLSVISLKDRQKVIEYFNLANGPDFDGDSIGKKIIYSNNAIISGFSSKGINCSARTLSVFLYSQDVRPLWRVANKNENQSLTEIIELEIPKDLSVQKKSSKATMAEWVPPIISDLQELALNKETEWSKNMNLKPERAFEIKLGYAFRILGYNVEDLGQGKGREPDGIAYSTDSNSEHYYAIVYDAKAREMGYSIGTGDRQIGEYIKKYQKELQRQRIRIFSFLIVSSEFTDNLSLDRSIKDIYKDTRCPVVLMKANDLLHIIAHKLSHSGIDHSQLEDLFLENGIVTQEKIIDTIE